MITFKVAEMMKNERAMIKMAPGVWLRIILSYCGHTMDVIHGDGQEVVAELIRLWNGLKIEERDSAMDKKLEY